MDPADRLVGGYVDWEWDHARYLFDDLFFSVRDKDVLEFGCHLGATSCVLAALGARVTGVDPDASMIKLACANADRHGLDGRTRFLHVPDTSKLPFERASFDVVSCVGVLQYVPADRLGAVQRELDRVLRPGGHVVIYATGNRLWPREVHHGRWLVNYISPAFDRVLFGKTVRRGVWPWQIRNGFRHYRDLMQEDKGRRLMVLKARENASPGALALQAVLNSVLVPFGAHYGYAAPFMITVLQKP